MIDTAELMSTYLSAQPALVAALTDSLGTHIYGPPGLPTNFVLRRAILFLRSGGPVDEDLPIVHEVFQFRCYGPTSWDASQVYILLDPFFTRLPATQVHLSGSRIGLLQHVHRFDGPTDNVEPMTEWPFIFARYQVEMGENPMVLP